jgi:4-amino-4-deoxy-L-arabinose transferase-like glycosyltransferase
MSSTTRLGAPVSHSACRGWNDLTAVALLILFIALIYFARLGTQPVVGEESRWGTGAREMLASGDWIVPRQQGHVFPERPPMTMWGMAVAGWARGTVDPIAIRLPSVLAVMLTSVLIYLYTRLLTNPMAAVVAALAYPTMGQVLQIGRLGESEAMFALFVSASLLTWHLGYLRGWPRLATWSIGFACAALAALVKGPQAPIYFIAITAVYLAVVRNWRYLLCWQYAAGATLFVAMIAAWQVPFYLATDWSTVKATWSGLAADRFQLRGVITHAATYPLETFACLLPWSPLLVALVKRETRSLLSEYRRVTTFLYVAILVAYPTVWMASGARGRYFMPLYPLIAVLIALIIDRCSASMIGRYPRRAWHQFLLLWGSLIGIGGSVVGGAAVLSAGKTSAFYQPAALSFALAVLALGAVAVIWNCYRAKPGFSSAVAVMTIGAFVGLAYTGVVINVNVARWNNPKFAIDQLKAELPPHTQLVSFTPVEHRFAYYYETPIAELEWPLSVRDVPHDVEYFCFIRSPGDTAESRIAGRGRTWTRTSGSLPFAWQEIAALNAERSFKDKRTVVVGHVIRPLRAETSDATRPRLSTANRKPGTLQN